MKKLTALLLLSTIATSFTHAGSVTVTMNSTKDHKNYGQVVFTDTPYGLLVKPALSGLPAQALHGFHLHQHANCSEAGMSAGGHYDPKNTGSHQGPFGSGHAGDLPVLFTTADGTANIPMLAPRLKTNDLKGLALMIHAGGDNYSDKPLPLGGGGARIACGAIS